MADTSLLHGPYVAPACAVGDVLTCEARGAMVVVRHSSGPLAWPIGRPHDKGGAPSFVLIGDLVHAIRTESAQAVAALVGVDRKAVTEWRRLLGVGRHTEGTMRARSAAVAKMIAGGTASRTWTSADDALVVQFSPEVAAERTGRGLGAIHVRRYRLRQAGVEVAPAPAPSLRGAERRDFVRQLHAHGLAAAAIAESVGLSIGHVRTILREG